MRHTIVHDSRPRLNAARHVLVNIHFWLADAVASRQFRHSPFIMPWEELQAEARYALVQAAIRFEESRGIPFRAFASLVIQQQMIRVFKRWQRDQRQRSACPELARWQVNNEDWLHSELVCPRTVEPWKSAAGAELQDQLRRWLPQLWYEVLELHYVSGKSVREIAAERGLSLGQVRRLLRKTLDRARKLCLKDWRDA
jgi:RNA polymerase sigma factor (sigma-70 family)